MLLTIATVFVFMLVSLFYLYVSVVFFILTLPEFNRYLRQLWSEGGSRKWDLGYFLVSLTLPDCSLTFLLMNFATGCTKCVDFSPVRVNKSMKVEV